MFTKSSFINVPTTIDLRMWAGDRENQLSDGKCTGETIVNSCEATALRLGYDIDLSAAYNYFQSRTLGGISTATDEGSTLELALRAAKNGVASTSAWTDDHAHVNIAPTAAASADAQNFKVLSYEEIYLNRDSTAAREGIIKSAMAQGYFVLFSGPVTKSFVLEHRNLKDQMWIDNTITNGSTIIGGHAVTYMFSGLPGTSGGNGVENSWGPGWGDDGFGLFATQGSTLDRAYIITGVEIKGTAYDLRYTNERVDVAELYVALFGRAPDHAGLDYWANQMAHVVSQSQIAEIMFGVEPARAYYPNGSTNSQIVAEFYENVLGRVADAQGLTYWVNQLNHSSKGAVITSMIDSALNYTGTDTVACNARELFENKLNVSMYYSVQMGGDNIAVASHALDFVTADANSVEIVKTGLPPDII